MTGALGCIGAWTIKALAERGDVAVVFDRSDDTRRLDAIMSPDAVDNVKFVYGDITQGVALRDALEKSGALRIIHLAGLQVPTCRADPVAGAMVNVVGTLNVFEAARAIGAERVVYASSAAVFGLSEDDAPLDENAPVEPSTHYGVFKKTNEGNARIYFLDHGLSSVALRPLTVYGVGRDTGLTSDPTVAIKEAVLGRSFHIRFSGPTDFIYVSDTAAAFIECADHAPEGSHIFNLHGQTVEVSEFVRVAEDQLPVESRGLISFGGPPIPIAPAMNDAAIRSVIGYIERTPLDHGIRDTVERFTRLRDEGRLE